jgi:di/tricarboxylate transporter
MTLAQVWIFAVLALTLGLFISGRWRYDVVALLALLAVALPGLVSGEEAFAGFGHPAVITVAAVLVASQGLQQSGLVSLIARWLSGARRPTLQVASLSGLVAAFSGFMNNIGALAILMPVALRMANRTKVPASILLMPLAFSSLLGGMITLIGTPPNIIVAAFRAETGAAPFGMFDFAPVGLGVAAAGVVFISLVGWRLIPQRKGQASTEERFRIEDYLTEVRVPKESRMAGRPLRDLGRISKADAIVVGLVRGERRLPAPSSFETVRADDILIVEANPDNLAELVEAAGLELAESRQLGQETLGSDEVVIAEAAVMPDSVLIGRSARSLNLRQRFGVNLLAVARQGARLRSQLSSIRLQAGDVLLLQAPAEGLGDALASLGSLPLAERGLKLGQPRRVLLAVSIFGAALAVAAVGWLPVQLAFAAAAVAMVLAGLLTLREAYNAINWPILVLLGAMIPVGQALETTGAARLIADGAVLLAGYLAPAATVAIVLVATMFLSDVVNNAAATVLMAPIAVSIGHGLGASTDPFLIAVAVGASCAFLTPIGHQSNTLVMGPGGYRFGDYWRMGLPLEVIILAVGLPLILRFWPLFPGG